MRLSHRHPYQSQPWDWLVITRPVAFYWESYTNAAGTNLAPATSGPWVREVLAIGNPAIWWLSIPALLFCLAGGSPGATGGLAPPCWLPGRVGNVAPFTSRTKFYYYALEFEPFIIICIVLCLGLIIGPATAGQAAG